MPYYFFQEKVNEKTHRYKPENKSFKATCGQYSEVITEDLRLLDRFLNPIKAVIKK